MNFHENIPQNENDLARDKIKYLIKNNQSDSESNQSEIEEDIEEETPNKLSKERKNSSNDQKSPILSPLNLNLIKSSTQDNNEDEETSQDSFVKKPNKSKRILDSDETSSNDSSTYSNNTIKKRRSKIVIESEDESNSVEYISSSSNDSNVDIYANAITKTKLLVNSETKKKESRHVLRNIIDDSQLKPETSRAIMQENERLKRLDLLKIQKVVNNETENDLIVLNSKTKEFPEIYLDNAKLLRINSKVSCHLKDHQIKGIQFMFDSCYESLDEIKNGNLGTGCVLAHCMGLGKLF